MPCAACGGGARSSVAARWRFGDAGRAPYCDSGAHTIVRHRRCVRVRPCLPPASPAYHQRVSCAACGGGARSSVAARWRFGDAGRAPYCDLGAGHGDSLACSLHARPRRATETAALLPRTCGGLRARRRGEKARDAARGNPSRARGGEGELVRNLAISRSLKWSESDFREVERTFWLQN